MASAPGIETLVSPSEAIPDFDVHAPLLSLPYLCGTDGESIPAIIPYLSADAMDLPEPGDRNIGLVWAGNPDHKNDRNRTINAARLKPLLGQAGARFYSLQVGDTAEARLDVAITDMRPHLTDFAQTAAVIAALNLVISVDISVAHLAGAMGKPVWLLLLFVPDFRWMLERADSPWYPSMRLFRQPKAGDWDSVIQALAARLQEGPESF